MKNNWYEVKFEVNGRKETVFAGCAKDAIILAQAEQIKKGNRYDDLLSVEVID